jgi:hypothetical protein
VKRIGSFLINEINVALVEVVLWEYRTVDYRDEDGRFPVWGLRGNLEPTDLLSIGQKAVNRGRRS